MSELARYESFDPRFAEKHLSNVHLERLHTGCRWAEGPVWFSDGGYLLWSDIPNDRILRWIPEVGVSVFRYSSNHSNGNTRDRQGRLVSCEHGERRVSRTEPDGSVVTLADSFEGRRLNSPNDAVVHEDGSVFFTDPSYGIADDYEGHRSEQEQPCRGVYRIDGASGELTRLVDDFAQPNGLAFSPDFRLLYIADSGRDGDGNRLGHIRRFDVAEGGRLSGGEIFCTVHPGPPDGIRVDTEGCLWSSAADGIHCFSPDGTLLGKILVPEVVSNLTFGGARGNRLLITATTSIYSIFVRAVGAAPRFG